MCARSPSRESTATRASDGAPLVDGNSLLEPLTAKESPPDIRVVVKADTNAGDSENALENWRGLPYWGAYLTLLSISFAGFVDYSVIMPSAQSYCESMGEGNAFYGIALGAYPLARIAMLPVAGLLADRGSMRSGLFLTVGLQILGSATYGLAQAAGSPYLILLGRLVAGCGSTNNAIAQKFVVQTTSTKERSRGIAILQAVNLLGVAIGPATNFFLSTEHFTLLGDIEFNQNTGAGFLMVIFHVFNAALLLFFFADPPAPLDATSEDYGCAGMCRKLRLGFKAAVGIPGGKGAMLISLFAMLWLSLLEALVSPIARSSFNWSLQNISVFFAAFAVVAAILMVVVGVASKCLQDRSLMALSIFFYAPAIVMFFAVMPDAHDVVLVEFLISAGLITVGFTCQNSPAMSLFTKMLQGTEHEGLTSSIILQAQGAGRVLGPVIAGMMLDHGGLKGCAYVLAALLGFQIVLVICNWRSWDETQLGSTVLYGGVPEEDFHTPTLGPTSPGGRQHYSVEGQ